MSANMGMDSLHLDGNSAAGLLGDIFAVDVTTATASCAGCGDTGSLGGLMLFAHQMGAVLRCPACQGVVVRIVRTPTHVWLDASGARSIAIPLSS